MASPSDVQLQTSGPTPGPEIQAAVVGLGKKQSSGIEEVKERMQHGPATFQIMRQNRQAAEDGMLLVHPEKYLEASFEVFLFMLAICWITTAIFTWDAIDGKPHANRIKDIFSYNNVCVGFDVKPAAYLAQPLMCLQAYFGVRYAMLDSLRAEMQYKAEEIKLNAYRFTITINAVFGFTMLLWGMLLIVPPGAGGSALDYHFYVYVVFVVVMYLTILANFIEAPNENISNIAKYWCIYYGIHTLLLLMVGFVGFNSYDFIQCPSDDVEMLVANGNFTLLCDQEPGIPVSFMSFLDYGWFILLVPTTMLLPASPPLVLSEIKLSHMHEDHSRALPFQADKHIARAVEQIKNIDAEDIAKVKRKVSVTIDAAAIKIQAIFRGNEVRKTTAQAAAPSPA